MARKSSFKFLAVVVVTVVSVIAALSLPAAKNAVFAAEYTEYYNNNKQVAAVIDPDDRFTVLYNADNIAQMQAIVKVATAISDFEKAYDAADYFEEEYNRIKNFIDVAKSECKVSSDNYVDNRNYYTVYSDYVDSNLLLIAEKKNLADECKTKKDYFDEYGKNAKKYIDDKASNMLADTKVNPTVAPNQAVNIYDETAQAEISALVSQAKVAIDAVAYDNGDYDKSVKDVDDTKALYSEKLDAIRHRRNDIERAVGAINDYYAAVQSGTASEDEIASIKQNADASVVKGYAFLEGASGEIALKYATQKSALDDYTAKDKEHDFSDIENKSVISDDKGIVTVTAMVDGAPANIFPYNAKAVINDNSGSIYKLNAENEIIKLDGNVSVAYCMDVSVYRGVGKWDAITELDGKEVTYKVAVDLNKYYAECIEGYSTWLDDNLKEKDIEKEQRDNYIDAIKECVGYISDNETEIKLCYHYLGRSNIEGLAASIEGDSIIFETKSFSNFAVVKAGGRSVLTSPVFWLIFILALVIAFVTVVIVMACVKYTITFNTNGGSQVAPIKVRKDEYFIMPQAPAKRGYTFGGWFEDQGLNVRFVDTCMVKRRSFKVYAKWNEALSTEQTAKYYANLRAILSAHAAMGESFEIEKGATIRLAKLVNEDIELKLYLALNPENVLKEIPVNVRAIVGENFAETPLLKTVDSAESFDEAVSLINLLIEQYDLKETEPSVAEEGEKEYVLELSGAAAEETATIAKEETPIEKTEKSVSKEQLSDYYKQIRKYAKGFALAGENGKIDKDAVIMRVILNKDCVEVYLNADAEKLGVEKAKGVLAAETPALVRICCDESLETAKKAVKAVMDELGLEETGEDVDLGDSDAKSFGYKLKFEE